MNKNWINNATMSAHWLTRISQINFIVFMHLDKWFDLIQYNVERFNYKTNVYQCVTHKERISSVKIRLGFGFFRNEESYLVLSIVRNYRTYGCTGSTLILGIDKKKSHVVP